MGSAGRVHPGLRPPGSPTLLPAVLVTLLLTLLASVTMATDAMATPSSQPAAGVCTVAVGSADAAADLQAVLDAQVADAAARGVTMRIAVTDLDGAVAGVGVTQSSGDGGRVAAASTIKVALAAYVLDGVDRGSWTLQTPVTVPADDVVGGSGTLGGQAAGRRYPLEQLLRLMITVSDNTAANALIDLVGGFDPVNAWLVEHGFDADELHLGRKMILPHAADAENWISADQAVRLLAAIHDHTLVSVESSERLTDLMRDQTVRTKLGAVIPHDLLADKTGENTGVSHDIGYLLVPGRTVAIAVLTGYDGAGADAANSTVQRAGAAVLALLQGLPEASAQPSTSPSPTTAPAPAASTTPSGPAVAETAAASPQRDALSGGDLAVLVALTGGAAGLAVAGFVLRARARRRRAAAEQGHAPVVSQRLGAVTGTENPAETGTVPWPADEGRRP